MKKLVLFLFSSMMILSVSAQTNLLENYGFETGDDTGWLGYNHSVIAADDAFEGSYVGAINDAQAGSFLYNPVAVTPGKTYKFRLTAKWPNGCSIDGIAMVIKDGGNTLATTEKIKTTEWSTVSAEVIIPAGVTEVKIPIWKPVSELCYIDSLTFYEVEGGGVTLPELALSDDGEILEDFEDGEVITVTLTNDTFVDPIVPENWTVTNLPAGVSAGAITRLSDTEVTITLSGNTTGDYDTDITNMKVNIAAEEFTTYESSIMVKTGVTFIATAEGTEEVIWEENFDAFTTGVNLDSAYLASMDFRTQGRPDSVQAVDGYIKIFTSELDGKNNWVLTSKVLNPGMTYKYSVDVKTPDGAKTFGVVWRANSDQIKTNEVKSKEWVNATAQFTLAHDADTVDLGVYRWGYPKETHFDNMKLVQIKEPTLTVTNDGEILEGAEDGEVITVKAHFDTFVAAPDIANWSGTMLPEGVSLGSLNKVDDTTVEITLAGNASVDYEADIVASVSASRDELTTSNKGLSANGVVFTAEVAVADPPVLAMTDDGEIKEGMEDGEVITVTLENDTFVDPLVAENWTVSNLPEGVTAAVASVNDTAVTVTLTGNTTGDYDADITDLTVSITAAELTAHTEDVSVSTGVTLKADVEVAAITMADDGEIKEGAEDGEVITVSLEQAEFEAALTAANWTLTNLPAGVTVGGVAAEDASTAKITLAGNASEDYDTDITNAELTVAAAEIAHWDTDLTAASGVTFVAEIESGIHDFTLNGLKIYPNPVKDQMIVSAEENIKSINVYDLLGNKVFEINELNDNEVELFVSHLHSGIYMVNVTDVNGLQKTVKIIK